MITCVLLTFPDWSVAAPTPSAKPEWSADSTVSTDSGYGVLGWSLPQGLPADLFELQEKFGEQQRTSFVTGRSLNVYRPDAGTYEFRIASCIKDDQGYPSCGPQSSKFEFRVTEAIYDPLIESGITAPPLEPVATSTVQGGPDQLRPGLWYNPSKDGIGWSFYWANRLALSSNPQNAYDLYGIWYTYEAKTRAITPICEPPDPPCGNEYNYYNYRPVVVTLQLVATGSNTFGGSVYIRRNGSAVQTGTATVTFGANNTGATVDWNVAFERQTLSDQDQLTFLVGEDGSPFSNPTDLAGLWDPNSGGDYFVVDDIGALSEAIEVVFEDDDGDPVWVQGTLSGAPSSASTDFCFYYVQGGYAPDLSGSIPSYQFFDSGCDHTSAASSTNRNGRRYFSGFEQGRYWISFTLPAGSGGNAPAGGSIAIGSSSTPAYFTKSANFSRIYTTNGSGCSISPTVSSCNAVLTWFTDGDYPDATVFAYNQTTGQRTSILTAGEPAYENWSAPLSVAGTYNFELRQSSSSSSRKVAESSVFTVDYVDEPLIPTGLGAAWTDQADREFLVSWNHADTGNVGYYYLTESPPDGGGPTVHTVSPGTTTQLSLNRYSGPYGTYNFQVKACSTASGSEICSDDTAVFSWGVTDPNPQPPPADVEYPWGDNEYGSWGTNNYNYAMGYHFKPLVNGTIAELGGRFSGTKLVKLFRRGGPELASAVVSSNYSWSYTSITPVAVSAGVEYTAAVYLAGSGGTYAQGVSFPQTFGQVEILATTYASTVSDPNAVPNSSVSTSIMYGQADVGFIPNSPTLEPPVISSIANQQHEEGAAVSLQVIASDSDGNVVAFDVGGTLPPGLSINNSGLISGTVAAGASDNSPYAVVITATDNDGLTDQESFSWTVNVPSGGTCTQVFVDDFETDKGWVRDYFGWDLASAGQWERANAYTTTYNSITYQLGTAPSETHSLVTDGRGGSGAGYTYDVDGGRTSISSPEILLPSDGDNLELTFQYNFAYISSSSSNDKFSVRLTRGAVETVLFEEFDNNASRSGLWRTKTLDLSPWAGETVRITFVADDDPAYGVLVEAQVDDVEVCYTPSANSPPVVLPPSPAPSSAVGETISPLTIQITDAENDPTTCDISGLPAGLAETSECVITGTVSATSGDYTVTVTAFDGALYSAPVNFNWNVYQGNTPPVVTSPGNQSDALGATIAPLTIQVADAEQDPVTCDIIGLPAGLAETSECTVSGTISAAAGDYGITVTAYDGELYSSPVNFVWHITTYVQPGNPEDPPDPVSQPSFAKDSTSSRVGATGGAFRVDESGSATYSIPILTAPGSGGMAPQVSLEYSSQAGNGPLGLGWSLGGLSSITRCGQTLAQDGLSATRGVSLTNSDRFCLDGQRLMAVSGAYGAAGTEYRTEIDGIAKIISYESAGNGPKYFKVWRKDGSISEYGNTADSRIEARTASDTQTVLVWAVNRIADSASNYIDFAYGEFTGSAGAPIEFVLSSVNYTGNAAVGTSPYAELTFNYDGNRDDVATRSVAGSTIAQTQRLSRIDSRAKATATSSMETLRSYFLGYGADGNGRSTLESVTECSDSSATYCFDPTLFSWLKSHHQISTIGTSVGSIFNNKHRGLALADVNGDARPDLLLSEQSGSNFRFRIALALPTGAFSPPSSTTYAIPADGNTNLPVSVYGIDLNADGYQDVVWPAGTTWKGRLSIEGVLGSEITVASNCCGLTNPPFVRVMDFDGDGLADIVTNQSTGSQNLELVFLRNLFSPSTPSTVGFALPQTVAVNLPTDLFPDTSTDGFEKDIEAEGLTEARNTNFRHGKTFDFNGDGAVDVLVKLSQKYTQPCVGPSCPDPQSASAMIGNTAFVFDPITTEATGDTAWAEFYAVLVSARNASTGLYEFNLESVVATGTNCAVYSACQPYAGLPVVQNALPLDANADGLADFAFRTDANVWKVRANLGGAFDTVEAVIVTQTSDEVASKSQFQDLNGDGLPEFMYPSALSSSSAVWRVHVNQNGSAFSAGTNSTTQFGNSDEADASIFVDFSGDGMLDNLFVDIGGNGTVQSSSTRLYLGQNSASGNPSANAVNLIGTITDGFGMQTAVTYKPLTDTSVYTRMSDSRAANWGSGHVVYDLIAPIHVVSQAVSSAPTYASSSATSSIDYHYVGAKLQGGGRGFLGFGEVISYDPQSGIRTNTRYRQDFPYVGLPADTTQALVSAASKATPISSPAASSPVAWSAVTATTPAPSLAGGGTLLSYAINEWAATETVAGKGTWFPHIADSLARSYTRNGAFDRKVLTSNSYGDLYGNLTQAVVRTYASDGSSAFATQTAVNTFTNDVAKWHLGRLTRTAVTHARTGSPSITRTSSFDYDPVTGILDREVVEPDNSAFTVTTDHQLDSFGNRIRTTVTGSGMAARNSYATYDALGRFMTETRNAYNQVTQKVTDWDAFGNPSQVENIDGVVTLAAADHMGRPFISYTETGAWSKTVHRAGAGSYCPSGTAFYTLTTTGGGPDQVQCHDLLDRASRSATEGFDGRMIYVDRYYDASGRLERVSEPYYANETRYWNMTSYDEIGRVLMVDAADGNDLLNAWDGNATNACLPSAGPRTVRITNGLGQDRIEVRNALGETTDTYDALCGHVNYQYDAIGNLVQVVGADGAAITTTYDLAGRKTALDDPDKGYWQYAYNALGELTRQLDSKSQAIDFDYDLLGRVVTRRELTGVSSLGDTTFTTVHSETTTWRSTSPGKAQVGTATYREGTNGTIVHQRAFSYDAFGRVDLVSTTLDGLTLAEQTTYDQYGRLFQQFDASGDDRGLRYHYNGSGYAYRLREAREGTAGTVYQDIQAMDARGNVTFMLLGNGVEAYASYQPASGRLDTLEAYDAQGVELQRVDYVFDVAGNLLSRHDTSGSRNLDETFNYDGLNRLEEVLKAVNGGATQATLSLNYDESGNITYKSGVGNYLYDGAGPHAVTSAGGVSYSYDANGNQVSGDGRSIAYSVFDKPTLITKGADSTEFDYGLGNQRIRRSDDNAVDGSKTTWYFGSVERIQVGTGNPYFKRYLGGVAIADFYPTTQVQDLHYLVKDHLGSIHTITDETGLAINAEGLSFNAFGQRRAVDWSALLTGSGLALANSKTTRGFTGHEHADGMGLVHMNGRIYDPRLGRMLQADPFVQSPKDSQSLNRYTYVNNNPLSYTDPSGYFSFSRFVKKWGRVIVAVAASIVTYGAASGWAAGWLAGTALAGNTIAIGAIAGGIAGFVGGAIISGNIQGAVKGAFSGAILGGVAGYFGNTYSLNRIAADSLAGGIASEIYGQEFKDGALFGALVSAATFITVRLRAYQKAQSAQFPGQIGESKGFRGIEGKVAGERIFEDLWIESGAASAYARGVPFDQVIRDYYLPFKNTLSPLGGFQGGEGLIFGQSYRSGGLVDYVLEGYSGVHDSLNQPYFYTANGTNRTLSGFWQKNLGYLINPANVVLASPIVLPALVPDYLRYVYFQAQDI